MCDTSALLLHHVACKIYKTWLWYQTLPAARHFEVFGGNISSATPIEVDFESGFRGRMISMAILGELLGSKAKNIQWTSLKLVTPAFPS